MSDIVKGLTLPIILCVIGAIFVLLGVAGTVKLKEIVIKLSPGRQKVITAFGIVLVVSGVFVNALPQVVPQPTSTRTALSPVNTATNPSVTAIITDMPSCKEYGDASHVPVPADYDGDGKVDLGVKTNGGVWCIDYYAINGFGLFDEEFGEYGDESRIPVPADYDGDGKTDLSVKGPDGVWRIDYAINGFGLFDEEFGEYGDESRIPVPADYDGDGKADLSVKGPDGVWWIDYAIDGFGEFDERLGGQGQ